MHRFVILLVGVVVLVKTDFNIRECFDHLKAGLHCCDFNLTKQNETIMKECSTLIVTADRDSCELATCYGEKVGYILSNGTVDKTLLTGVIEKNMQNYTDLWTTVKDKCLSGDVKRYGPPHLCYVKRIGICIRAQVTFNCPKWKSSEKCNSTQQKIEECKSSFH